MAERFEPALVRGRLGGAYRLYGRAALPFRPGMNRFGQVQKGLEWDI